MDPNATWHDLALSVQLADWDTASEQAQNLLDWLDKGGFPPKITDQELFDKIVARSTCQAIAAWEVA